MYAPVTNYAFLRLVFLQTTSPLIVRIYNKPLLLRSTKWNANLILLRDYAELVALCKVIVWKTHIPVRTQK